MVAQDACGEIASGRDEKGDGSAPARWPCLATPSALRHAGLGPPTARTEPRQNARAVRSGIPVQPRSRWSEVRMLVDSARISPQISLRLDVRIKTVTRSSAPTSLDMIDIDGR